ncbi:MAG: ZIP family metal transporter [Deltaproteobacteria bacterium]|nr:ZIP family metal transporter [Deltaproteobacteria bacterium]
MLSVLLAATATGLCTGVGALPFFVVGRLPRRAYDAILGFGAGLMLSAATIGLLGHALGRIRPAGGHLSVTTLLLVLGGFGAGFLILLVVERLIPHEHAGGHREHLLHGGRRPEDDEAPADHEHAHDRHDGHDHGRDVPAAAARERAMNQRLGVAISGALVFHRLPEGFAIGASFATGETAPLGGLVAIAVGLQNVCEGLVGTAPLRAGGLSAWKALGIAVLTGVTMPLAAALGYLFSRHIEGALPFALALGAGSLIAVTSNEIIPETHSHGNEVTATVGVVLGFVFTIVLRVVLGVD